MQARMIKPPMAEPFCCPHSDHLDHAVLKDGVMRKHGESDLKLRERCKRVRLMASTVMVSSELPNQRVRTVLELDGKVLNKSQFMNAAEIVEMQMRMEGRFAAA